MLFPRLALLAALLTSAQATPGYFRAPALHGETLVFTAEGDLWKVPVGGGEALRLTTHPGIETSATISPDGASVAFSAQYEGPTECYVMPLDGGLPRRLTWTGEGTYPVGWTPDGEVLCATRAHSTLPDTQLVTINLEDGTETLLPLAQASDGAFDITGTQLVFTRLPFQGSSTKRYVGGTVQNLWSYGQGADEATPLTADFSGTSKNPMREGNVVYFLSDRDGTMNLWSMPAEGGAAEPLTRHPEFDIEKADLDQGRIAYQHKGTLRLYSLEDATDREIPITLPSDFDQTRHHWVQDPFDYLTRFSVSPDGSRVALTARGSVFVAPTKPGGRLVEINKSPGVRYREAAFMPDGKSIIAQTDETGEIEMVQLPANGVGEPQLLTQDGSIFRFAPVPSPDGSHIAWQDKNLELWVRDLVTRESVKVSTSPIRGFPGMTWSPDSKWLAFVEPAANSFQRIRLYNLADRNTIEATSDRVMSHSPAWSADGKWLYFLSDRKLKSLVRSPWGPRQPEPYFTESTRIYALALQNDLRFPFTPPDELSPQKQGKEKEKTDELDEAKPMVSIDSEGLTSRIYEIPSISGNLSGLTATKRHLFYISRAPGTKTKPQLMRLAISHESPDPKVFAKDPQDWDLSADGKSVAIRKGKAIYVVPTNGDAPAKLEKAVPLGNWTFSIDPKEEWHQIYDESWRMLRDYFYDPDMHGVDWRAIHEKYKPLVDRVADRSDLAEVLHHMGGELSALHTYVRFGDIREGPDKIQPSSLGAKLARDPESGGWRIDHLYRADPDYPEQTSPLAKPGVGLKEDDVIVSINGRNTESVEHPQQLLEQKANQQVLLEVLSDGVRRSVLVEPMTPEAAASLRYSEWEYTRRMTTEKTGLGKIGYVHLRNMGPDSILEWARDYFPVFDRQGLIIDMRHNRGGNTDSWILSRLLRKAWFFWSARAGTPYSNMQYAFRGHLVVICNEWTASDGEAFSEGFRRLGLGKVIGTRTWGGQIWLSAQRWLVDNGMCSAAEFGVYGPEGEWLIEGTGIEPDIIVDNLPHATFLGEDKQLDAAIQHLQKLIAEDPREIPQPPPRPNKMLR